MEVDLRNADGLIVLSDLNTRFWAFRMDRLSGWNGEKFGVPNFRARRIGTRPSSSSGVSSEK